jgi:hypothetical protein
MAVSAALRALARLSAGDWAGAHGLVQDDPSSEAAWVHAHLHRVEGDLANARYWYERAGRPEASGDFEAERHSIERAIGSRA